MEQNSAEVARLLAQRAAARAARDYERADRLREQLRLMGWQVIDESGGARLVSLLDQVETHAQLHDARSRLQAASTHQFSICVVMAGWPEDVRRLVAALGASGPQPGQVEVIAVDQARQGTTPSELRGAVTAAVGVRVLRVDEELGHAQAWTLAAHQAGGQTLVFAEPSLEFGTEVLMALGQALDEPGVGLVGAFGLRRRADHNFDTFDGPEVDALEYLFAIRRSDFARIGDFDAHFRFYRMLDVDFSHQVHAAGLRLRRVDCPSIRRHEHRLWSATPEPERERLSRRNFNRFLDRWVRAGSRR